MRLDLRRAATFGPVRGLSSQLRRPMTATNYAFSKLRWLVYAPSELYSPKLGLAMRSRSAAPYGERESESRGSLKAI